MKMHKNNNTNNNKNNKNTCYEFEAQGYWQNTSRDTIKYFVKTIVYWNWMIDISLL